MARYIAPFAEFRRRWNTWSAVAYQFRKSLVDRCQLLSASRHHITVPCYRLSTFGCWTFSVAGPALCNSLPACLRDQGQVKECSSMFGRTRPHTLADPTRVPKKLW